jgi:hypothetical protein
MQAFTVGPARWRTVRAFGRNPLLRTSDRIEAIAVALAVAIALLITPVAAAIGTAVYDASSAAYAREAHTRHAVIATVTKTETSAPTTSRQAVYTMVHARWRVAGIGHTDAFVWRRGVSTGDQIGLWVDGEGKRAGPPPAPRVAALDAISAAGSIWLVVVTAAAAVVASLRWCLGRVRDAQWEREIRNLVDGGGRTNTQR